MELAPRAQSRRTFIGGSDARIIMGNDEAALTPPLAREARRSGTGGPLGQSCLSSSES